MKLSIYLSVVVWIASGSLAASAGELHPGESFQYELSAGDQKITLVEIIGKNLVISSSCQKPDGTFECKAYRALASASLKAAQAGATTAGNPGARICTLLRGDILFARDEKLNEQTLCRFEDGSLLDNGSLVAHGVENDQKRSGK